VKNDKENIIINSLSLREYVLHYVFNYFAYKFLAPSNELKCLIITANNFHKNNDIDVTKMATYFFRLLNPYRLQKYCMLKIYNKNIYQPHYCHVTY